MHTCLLVWQLQSCALCADTHLYTLTLQMSLLWCIHRKAETDQLRNDTNQLQEISLACHGMMGVSCSKCGCNDEASDAKILHTAAVCHTACEDSIDDMVIDKTIETRQLEIEFELPDGSIRVVCFTRRPLGLDFNRHMPITMKYVRPGSHAGELGVQQGWRIRSLHGYDVTQLAFQDVYRALRESSERLQ